MLVDLEDEFIEDHVQVHQDLLVPGLSCVSWIVPMIPFYGSETVHQGLSLQASVLLEDGGLHSREVKI